VEVVTVVTVGDAGRNPFKHRLAQNDPSRQSDMRVHNIVLPNTKRPAKPDGECDQVGSEGTYYDPPAQRLNILAKACGRRPEGAKIEFELAWVKLSCNLQQPGFGSAARYGPHYLEHP
jgi:hypothetical protein